MCIGLSLVPGDNASDISDLLLSVVRRCGLGWKNRGRNVYVSYFEVNERCAASMLGTLIGISIKSIHEGMDEPKLHVTGASGA